MKQSTVELTTLFLSLHLPSQYVTFRLSIIYFSSVFFFYSSAGFSSYYTSQPRKRLLHLYKGTLRTTTQTHFSLPLSLSFLGCLLYLTITSLQWKTFQFNVGNPVAFTSRLRKLLLPLPRMPFISLTKERLRNNSQKKQTWA